MIEWHPISTMPTYGPNIIVYSSHRSWWQKLLGQLPDSTVSVIDPSKPIPVKGEILGWLPLPDSWRREGL